MSVGASAWAVVRKQGEMPQPSRGNGRFAKSAYDPLAAKPSALPKAAPAPQPVAHEAVLFVLPDVNTVSSSWKVFPP